MHTRPGGYSTGDAGRETRNGQAMDSWLIVLLVVLGVLLLALLGYVLSRRAGAQRREAQAREHLNEAQMRQARAETSRAAADEQAARLRRERAELEQRVAQQEREAAQLSEDADREQAKAAELQQRAHTLAPHLAESDRTTEAGYADRDHDGRPDGSMRERMDGDTG